MDFELINTAGLPDVGHFTVGELRGPDHVIPVLDDGHVYLVDVMGNDQAIVDAARVSYGKGTKKLSGDRGLIRYLMANRHTTPFEMCEIKFRVRCPMDCWRQWIRHRTANVNEYSTRYSIAIDAMQKTAPDRWRRQSGKNKQGSEGFFDEEMGARFTQDEADLQVHARQVYEDRLTEYGEYELDNKEGGVAREQARKDLPLSTYTEAYWKIDLHNLFHFLGLRLEAHAQLEIRAYAQAMAWFVQQWCPIAWEAFMDFRIRAMYLSNQETMLLREMVEVQDEINDVLQKELNMTKREMVAFREKVERLGAGV